MVDVRRLEITSEIREGVGTVMDLTSELFGLPLIHDVMEITVWEKPSLIEVVHKGQFTGSAAFRLEPSRGGTIFIWQEEFKAPLGPLGEIAHKLVVAPHLRQVFGRSMDNVRKLAEAL